MTKKRVRRKMGMTKKRVRRDEEDGLLIKEEQVGGSRPYVEEANEV